ncbi:hypothetical protein [Fulvivirga lutea]|uniref:Uncharacterized protein n=1 Tax=Fulvivirga lutea TaxID=2810512 RepID=A0A974WJC2_9BACT|nr:hypothetical protein [Fulvivirga lutea]QSE99004.1 hypothetical protein JR347_07935 [Fulvivirga lutea]
MTVDFFYNLDSAGWADATISEGTDSETMTVSYLHDSLGELTDAMNLLLKGGKESQTIFMSEPGEHLMSLINPKDDLLEIEVRWFKDWASWNMHSKTDYEVVFKRTTSLFDFANKICDNLERIYIKEGIEGYKEKWVEHDFPMNSYLKLKKLLGRK